jgi:hypothetical protein
MKKLILSALACIALVISSCNQNSPAPSPATPTPTPAPTPTSSMTATEALLVGDWIWDKTETYQSGNLATIWTPTTLQYLPSAATTNTTYAGSHVVLKSSFYNNTATTNTLVAQNYNADYYSNYNFSSYWNVNITPNGPLLGGVGGGGLTGPVNCIGYILTLNANTLICQSWTPGQIANGTKYYYHK